MLQTITISSKRQITIPSTIFADLQLSEGDILIGDVQKDTLVLQKASHVLDALAGSIKIPNHKKKLTIEEAIHQAPKKYFSKNNK